MTGWVPRRDGATPRGLAGVLRTLPFPGEDSGPRLFTGSLARPIRSRGSGAPESWERLVPRARRWVDHTGAPSAAELINDRWRDDAACAGADPDAWFPEPGGTAPRTAVRVCVTCPVRRMCLAWALAFDERHGTWGGMSAAAREPLQKRVNRGAALGSILDSALGTPSAKEAA